MASSSIQEIKLISFNGNYSTFGKMNSGRWQEFENEKEYEDALKEESEFQKILSGKMKGGISD